MWKFGIISDDQLSAEGYYCDAFGNADKIGNEKIEKALWKAYKEGKIVSIKFKDGTIRKGRIDCPYGISLACAETFKGGIYWFEDNCDNFFGSEVEEVVEEVWNILERWK
jgi:hypothetical protein